MEKNPSELMPYEYGEFFDRDSEFKEYRLCPESSCGLIGLERSSLRKEHVCIRGHVWHLDYKLRVTPKSYFESAEYEYEFLREDTHRMPRFPL